MKNPHRRNTKHAVAFATLALTHVALGQITNTYEWSLDSQANPGLPKSWDLTANWATGVVPSLLSDGARITNGGTAIIDTNSVEVGMIFVAGGSGSNLIIDQEVSVSARQIRIGTSQAGTITMNAGTLQLLSQDVAEVLEPELVIGIETGGLATLTQTGGFLDGSAARLDGGHPDTRIGAFGGSGVYNLQGGGANLYNLRVGFANPASVGTINHSSGTLNHFGELALGWADATGNYNLSGDGILTTNNRIRVGATAGTEGTFTQSGGSAEIFGGRLELGTEGGAHGTYDMSGGTMVVHDNIFVGAFDNNAGTSGTYLQSGGDVTCNQMLVAFATGGFGDVTLSGGILRTQSLFVRSDGGEGGTGVLTFNGGTLVARGGGNFIYNFPAVNLAAGGATIDSNDNGITIVPPIIGPGGLTKTGENQLTLTALNNYEGNTVVNNGRLILTQPGGLNPTSTVSILNEQDGADAKLVLEYAGMDTVSRLRIDGIDQPPGIYGSLDNLTEGIFQRGYIQGTGLLKVEPVAGYDNWAGNPAFGLTEAQQAPDQDPDNDGLDNLLEYVLGGNPSVSDPGIAPAIVISGGDIQISFDRSVESGNDTTAVIEWSTDLESWPPANQIAVTGTGPITQTIPAANAAGGKLFTRVRITKP